MFSSLLITLLLGLFFVAGILIVRFTKNHGIVEHISIAVAFGAMVALLALDLVPEVIESYELPNLWQGVIFIAAGMALLKVLDLFVPEHGAHDEAHHNEGMAHIGIMSAIAVSLHNILEGMTVYGIASLDMISGISLAFGVGLHNIPMGMLIYATLRDEKKYKKLLILSVTVLSTFIGGLVMMGISSILDEQIINALICITIGMVVFIAAFELLPHLLKDKRWKSSLLFVLIGFLIVLLGTILN